MDPEKQSAGLNWPRPLGLHAVQCFLGLANYYHQFIPYFSTLMASLTTVTKKGNKLKDWTPQAEEAFSDLKKTFRSAAVSVYPDPSKPFYLEVYISTVESGTDFSQKGRLAVSSLEPSPQQKETIV